MSLLAESMTCVPKHPEGDARLMDTIKMRTEGAVLSAEIAAPPMNLLGPELVRDLVSLIRFAEEDDSLKVRAIVCPSRIPV
jgi:hypothetical protein